MRAIIIVLVLCMSLQAHAQSVDHSFVLETHDWEPYTPGYLGSGRLGLSTTRLGTDAAVSHLAGVYDNAPQDVPRLALLPAWNAVDVFNGEDWLNRSDAVRKFHQTLDMKDATLRTEYEWGAPEHAMGVAVESFVSRAEPTLGVVRVSITPQFAGEVKIRLDLSGRPQPPRHPFATMTTLEPALRTRAAVWYPGEMAVEPGQISEQPQGAILRMTATPVGTQTAVAAVAAAKWPQRLSGLHVEALQAQNSVAVELTFDAAQGKTYTFEKFVALSAGAASAEMLRKAEAIALRSKAAGYRAIREAHRAAWRERWKADIEVEGDPELQAAIHAMLFYLLESAPDSGELSIPPMGLSNAGYFGHVFWDADTFMFPVLLALHPDLARQIVMFRYRTLDVARKNAAMHGYKGAMYPWEAGPDGAETTPAFAGQNATSEVHVNADVALAQWQYFLATNDREWLRTFGYPIIRDTAEFWLSRVTYNPQRGAYEILKVVSVDEAKIGVDNDPYTNAAARNNLELAAAAATVLGVAPDLKWAEVAGKIYQPRTDSILIDYPLEMPMSELEKRTLLSQALEQAVGRQDGVMMEWGFYPILAVELREKSALRRIMEKGYKGHLRPPFLAVSETPSNNNTNFLTGASAFLHQFLFGYAGLRFSVEDGLSAKVQPLLPEGVDRLVLRNVWIRGRRTDIAIDAK